MPAKKLFLSVIAIVAVALSINAFKLPVARSGKKNETIQQTAYESCKLQAASLIKHAISI